MLTNWPVLLHSALVNLWCERTTPDIIAPCLFEEKDAFGPVTCTVTDTTSVFYLNVIPALQQHRCMDEVIFMQNGALLHIANEKK